MTRINIVTVTTNSTRGETDYTAGTLFAQTKTHMYVCVFACSGRGLNGTKAQLKRLGVNSL